MFLFYEMFFFAKKILGNEWLRLLENMSTMPQKVNFSCSPRKNSVVIKMNRMTRNSSALAFCLAMPWPLSLLGQDLLNDKKINVD